MEGKRIVIIGAGPAGLTAARELADGGHQVIILESDPRYVGGLARTQSHNDFRFDIGAHRFFTKNSEIAKWWHARLPHDFIRIKRLTRILYRGRFFQYPLRPVNALMGLGLRTSILCVLSYLWRLIRPITPERSFEDWIINRFGDRLYRIFFKTYTEKVWGMPCSEISPDWAAQRIKGLSLSGAILNALRGKQNSEEAVKTLVDEFDYPRLGPGMLWEKVRDEIVQKGGQIHMGRTVVRLERDENRILTVVTRRSSGDLERWPGDFVISSMPLRDCVLAMSPNLSSRAQAAAAELSYRDFLLVILIISRPDLFPDNWIYIHAPEVKVGRIENFNNWGKDMVPDRNVTCLAFEYFCSKGDNLWSLTDLEITELAKRELEILNLARGNEVLDTRLVRVEKAYPVYDSKYQENVVAIRGALREIKNLQVIGRNGMHKYNNQDHSMLTGMFAAWNLDAKKYDVWRVNTDAEYLEEGQSSEHAGRCVPRLMEQRDVNPP